MPYAFLVKNSLLLILCWIKRSFSLMSVQEILLMVLAVPVAAGLALWQYYSLRKQPNGVWLILLRFIAYLSLFLLLINPHIVHQKLYLEKPALVLAVDNSQSIGEFQAEQDVRDLVESLVEDKELSDKFSLDWYSFGSQFKKGNRLNFKEKQTDLGSVFLNLKSLYGSSPLHLVLITDGNQTIGRDFESLAKEWEGPISTVVVGDTTAYADLRIERINVNRYSFLENTFPVEVFVNYQGEEEVAKTFTLKEGDRVLFQKLLRFDHIKNATAVTAQLPAESVGIHTYTAEIAALEGEKNKENNKRNFAVEVIDQQLKVLLLSSFLHPDLGAFKKSIESNAQQSVEIKFIGDEIDWGEYQLVLLYQPTSAFQEAYKHIAEMRLNTLTVTGLQTDEDFLNRQQKDVHKQPQQAAEYYSPVYHPGYDRFQVEDIGFADFPPLQDQFGALELSAAYETILGQAVDGIETGDPLLMTVDQKGQKRAYLFGENTWQWRAKSYRDHGDFERYDRFVNQLVHYLASNKKRERLDVHYNSFYTTGEHMVFEAHYFDENYVFDPRAKLTLRVSDAEGKAEKDFPFILKNNRYEVNLSGLAPGVHQFKLSVEGTGLVKEGQFTLIEYDAEKQFKNAAYAKLKGISDQSPYTVAEGKALKQDLLKQEELKPVQKSKRERVALVDWKYLCFLIALVLGLEWLLRKYHGMV